MTETEAHPAGDTLPVGREPPTVPGFPRGGWAGSRGVRSAHRLLLAARLHHTLTGNEEKTARAVWKSPPGSMPECDSGGLAGQLPPTFSQDPGGPAAGNSTASLHILTQKSLSILMLQIQSKNMQDRVPTHQGRGSKPLYNKTYFL